MIRTIQRILPLAAIALASVAAVACDTSTAIDRAEKVAERDTKRGAPDSDLAPTSAKTPADSDEAASANKTPLTTVNGALSYYADCHAKCHVDHEGDALETCKLNCGAAAKSAVHTIEPKPEKVAFEAEVNSLRECVSSCDADTERTTNMHTCYLNCKNAATAERAASS